MITPITVTFVGGPEAGRRMRMAAERDYFRFAICPRMPSAPDFEAPHGEAYMQSFDYRVERLPGGVYVGVPTDWYDDKYDSRHWSERVFAELARGYTGRV